MKKSHNVAQSLDVDNLLKKSCDNNLDNLSNRLNLQNRTNKGR